jgi:hypothetical protein
VAFPSLVISNGAAGGGGAEAVARRRLANLHRDRGKASQHDRLVRQHHLGSQVRPGHNAAGTGAQIHREETHRRRRRLPARNPIRIGAVAAGGAAGGEVRGQAARRTRAVVRAPGRGPAEIAKHAEIAGIEWTSGALA